MVSGGNRRYTYCVTSAMADIERSRKLKKRFSTFWNDKLLINLICCLLSCVIWPLLVPIMLFFILIKQIVNVILKVKYGKSFGGILQSADAVSVVEDISKSIINTIIFIKVKPNNTQDFTQQIKERIFNKIFMHPEEFPKLTSIRLQLIGFNFLLKDQLTVEDCVSTLKISPDGLDRNILQEIVSEYSNKPLPKENSSLWEVLVSPIPMEWHSNGVQVFPILCRISHAVGDGLSLINLLFRIFADDINQIPNTNLLHKIQDKRVFTLENTEAKECTTIFVKLLLTLKSIMYFIFVILIAPMKVLHQTHIRKKDRNALHGPQLSGEKILVWAVEEKQKLVSVVKNIKRAAPGSKFLDVVLTAVSASLEKHFRRDLQSIPDYVTTGLLLSTQNMDKKPTLQNQFSIGLLELPILMETNSLEHRLQEVTERSYVLRNSPDYLKKLGCRRCNGNRNLHVCQEWLAWHGLKLTMLTAVRMALL